MKVLIAGGTGRVAAVVTEKLVRRGHTVLCGTRRPEQVPEREGVQAVSLDLHTGIEEMKKALQGADAIYFLAGSRGKDLLQTDAFGAVKLMQAAEESGVRRFILLSSIFSMEPERWAEEPSLAPITNYNIAKFFADQWLVRNTKLDYTIVQPSVLKEEPGTGTIEVNPAHDGSNPIPDVAEVLVQVLERPNTCRKVIKLHSGTIPIAEALDAL